jgi:predicted PurR-regulated permease PerM
MSPRPSTVEGGGSAPPWLVRSAAVAWRVLVIAVLVWLLAQLAVKLTLLLVSVLVALLLTGAFAPVVEWASRKSLPRWIAAALAVLVLLAVTVGVAAVLGTRIAQELPELRQQLQAASEDLSRTLGVDMPFVAGSGDGGGSDSAGTSASSSGGSALPSATSSVRLAADVAVGFFLTLALAFLFLKDGPLMWRWVLGKLGGRPREDTDAAGRAAWATVGSYVRGLTIVALFDAVGIGLGLLLLGVPLALTLAALQFVGSYVPTFGAIVAGALAVAVAYLSSGLGTAALVAGLVVVVQQIGNDVIEPYVMGRELPLNAAAVLIAVTAGGLLWGIAGALLFVPLAAAVSGAAHEISVRHGSRPVAGG